MSSTTHPHVKVIEGMTAAAISGDKDALAKIFTCLYTHLTLPTILRV
jgi:hypothetical protein